MVKQRIVLDPGHGGKDSGAIWNGVKEKDVVLTISNRLFELLQLTAPFLAFKTRSDDHFVTLKQRVEMANELPADLFISIHCNSFTSSTPHGVQVYFYKDADAWIARHFLKRLKAVYYEPDSIWNYVEKGNFYVLRKTQMPAILIELGFLSNEKDRQWVQNFDNQTQIITAILNALVDWQAKDMVV